MRKLLEVSLKETQSMKEDSFEKKTLSQLSEAIQYHDKIPQKLQVRKAEIEPLAHNTWVEAREKKDFNIFVFADSKNSLDEEKHDKHLSYEIIRYGGLKIIRKRRKSTDIKKFINFLINN